MHNCARRYPTALVGRWVVCGKVLLLCVVLNVIRWTCAEVVSLIRWGSVGDHESLVIPEFIGVNLGACCFAAVRSCGKNVSKVFIISSRYLHTRLTIELGRISCLCDSRPKVCSLPEITYRRGCAHIVIHVSSPWAWGSFSHLSLSWPVLRASLGDEIFLLNEVSGVVISYSDMLDRSSCVNVSCTVYAVLGSYVLSCECVNLNVKWVIVFCSRLLDHLLSVWGLEKVCRARRDVGMQLWKHKVLVRRASITHKEVIRNRVSMGNEY